MFLSVLNTKTKTVSHVQTLKCQNYTVVIKVLDLNISTTRQQIYTHFYIKNASRII